MKTFEKTSIKSMIIQQIFDNLIIKIYAGSIKGFVLGSSCAFLTDPCDNQFSHCQPRCPLIRKNPGNLENPGILKRSWKPGKILKFKKIFVKAKLQSLAHIAFHLSFIYNIILFSIMIIFFNLI